MHEPTIPGLAFRRHGTFIKKTSIDGTQTSNPLGIVLWGNGGIFTLFPYKDSLIEIKKMFFSLNIESEEFVNYGWEILYILSIDTWKTKHSNVDNSPIKQETITWDARQ